MNLTENGRVTTAGEVLKVLRLRLAVGLLGEKEQAGWWSSLWLTPNATAFLSPVYGERLHAARYHGVIEAARRIHDDRIGVGQAFHLFRLPEGLEHRLHEAVVLNGACDELPDWLSPEASDRTLAELSSNVPEISAGPMRIGSLDDLKGRKWISGLAAHYRAAFASSIQTYPYFADRQ